MSGPEELRRLQTLVGIDTEDEGMKRFERELAKRTQALKDARVLDSRALRDVEVEYERCALKYGLPEKREVVDLTVGEAEAMREFGRETERIGRMMQARFPGKPVWEGIFLEEVGEAMAEVQNSPAARKRLRVELIQVAHVALAWADALEARDGG